MADIIVTTPKSEMADSAEEAAQAIEDGGGEYWHSIPSMPKNCKPGDRVFYCEDGYVRGFAKISHFQNAFEVGVSGVGGKTKHYVVSFACSWQWIKPIPMKGFRGWRYFTQPFEIVGNWLDPKPVVAA